MQDGGLMFFKHLMDVWLKVARKHPQGPEWQVSGGLAMISTWE